MKTINKKFDNFIEPAISMGFDDGIIKTEIRDRIAWREDIKDFYTNEVMKKIGKIIDEVYSMKLNCGKEYERDIKSRILEIINKNIN